MWKVAPVFPARCVVCNDHANHRIIKTVYWHESWVYLTILAGILIYAIAAAVLRKSAHVNFGLCDKHRLRRTLGFVTIFGGFVLGLGSIFAWASIIGGNSGLLFFVGLAIMLGSAIAGIIMTQTLKPTRIDDHRAWFKTGAAFLDSLSHHPTPPPYAGYCGQAPTQNGPPGYPPAGYGPTGYGPLGYGPPPH